MRKQMLILLLIGIFLVSGCAKQAEVEIADPLPTAPDTEEEAEEPVSESPHSIIIQNFKFIPATLTVKVGDTVTWINQDTPRHTVTSDTGTELDSELLSKGETYTHVFNTAGNYPYHCTPHPWMEATIVVE
jgi:amicyanin